jgi:hypothetical protein
MPIRRGFTRREGGVDEPPLEDKKRNSAYGKPFCDALVSRSRGPRHALFPFQLGLLGWHSPLP